MRLPKSSFHAKIKTEHTILPFFREILNDVSSLPSISRLIPWRIYAKASLNTSRFCRFSYMTTSGMKYTMHDTKASQELFIICIDHEKESIQTQITTIIQKHIPSQE